MSLDSPSSSHAICIISSHVGYIDSSSSSSFRFSALGSKSIVSKADFTKRGRRPQQSFKYSGVNGPSLEEQSSDEFSSSPSFDGYAFEFLCTSLAWEHLKS
mmetsp:Transcript_16210/g.22844  ORF Transcript_16210/g.22844 Transcript_16210/m.22844 type:complete len:101 (-) Transcript_16210:707-1009(-)